jgi:hypothetical protein
MGKLRACLCGFGDDLEVWAPVAGHEILQRAGGPVASDLGNDIVDVSADNS